MKKWLFFIAPLILLASNANAQIIKAVWLPASQEIELTVRHGGGCKEHQWGIAMSGVCAETFPAQCSAKLIHLKGQDDFCEAIISTTSRVKITSHPATKYTLSISDGHLSKSVMIIAKKTPAPKPKSCKIVRDDGKIISFKPGQKKPDIDGCNTCTCQASGHVTCTELACANPRSCKSGNLTLAIGESFPLGDGCNSCTCTENGVGCTELFCGQ